MKKLTKKLQHLKINIAFRFYQFKLESIVYGLALLYGLIIGAFIEALILIISFNVIRPTTPITFHFRNVNICVKVSCVMFLVSISQISVIPRNVTLCASILMALFICLVLYQIEYYFAKKKYAIFDISKDTLLAIMENSTLSLEEKDAIQYRVIDKMKGDRFYRAMGYSKRQSIRIYQSAVAKLNNLINQ